MILGLLACPGVSRVPIKDDATSSQGSRGIVMRIWSPIEKRKLFKYLSIDVVLTEVVAVLKVLVLYLLLIAIIFTSLGAYVASRV